MKKFKLKFTVHKLILILFNLSQANKKTSSNHISLLRKNSGKNFTYVVSNSFILLLINNFNFLIIFKHEQNFSEKLKLF